MPRMTLRLATLLSLGAPGAEMKPFLQGQSLSTRTNSKPSNWGLCEQTDSHLHTRSLCWHCDHVSKLFQRVCNAVHM